jgi:hypothetical protein
MIKAARSFLMTVGRLFIFLAVLYVCSCATKSDVLQDKAEGTVNTYPVNFEEGWEICRRVFHWEGAEAIESHKKDSYMVTSHGPNGVSMGAFMAAWVEKVDENSTKITVVTKRKLATSVATPLTESAFHKRFEQAVKLLRAGKRLPQDAP